MNKSVINTFIFGTCTRSYRSGATLGGKFSLPKTF